LQPCGPFAACLMMRADATQQQKADWEQAVGECFADAVSPPVPFEQASAHECFEAVAGAFGGDNGWRSPASLSLSDRLALAEAIANWFECDAPRLEQIDRALELLGSCYPDLETGQGTSHHNAPT
jgi:hypothetical protein